MVRSWIRTVFVGPAAATSMNPSSRALTMMPASPNTAFEIGTRLGGAAAGPGAADAADAGVPDCACARPETLATAIKPPKRIVRLNT